MAAGLRLEQGGSGELSGLGARPTTKKRLSSTDLGATSSFRYSLVGRKEYSDWSETDFASRGLLDADHFPSLGLFSHLPGLL